ncbi:MAG: hypothetical protein Q7O04_07365 [Candidatus Omnitrophota bacterium]|nr:hypothetical protein [Candidatus Omnitrophota bacterium]
MLDKKITRSEFLKIAGFGIFTVFILPGLKKLDLFKKSHKEAKYYKKLAG